MNVDWTTLFYNINLCVRLIISTDNAHAGSEYLGEVGDMGKVINPIVLGEVDCDSMDQELLECNSSPLGIPTATCTHDKDVMIRCNGIKFM